MTRNALVWNHRLGMFSSVAKKKTSQVCFRHLNIQISQCLCAPKGAIKSSSMESLGAHLSIVLVCCKKGSEQTAWMGFLIKAAAGCMLWKSFSCNAVQNIKTHQLCVFEKWRSKVRFWNLSCRFLFIYLFIFSHAVLKRDPFFSLCGQICSHKQSSFQILIWKKPRHMKLHLYLENCCRVWINDFQFHAGNWKYTVHALLSFISAVGLKLRIKRYSKIRVWTVS